MRRKDREMSVEFGLQVIDKAEYGVLAVTDPEGDLPYAVPLSMVRRGRTLYFHSAKAGTKVDLFQEGTPVRVVFVANAAVPGLYKPEEARDLIKGGKSVDFVTGNIFTTEFSSAIVTGKIRNIEAREGRDTEFSLALEAICEKYVPDMMDFFELAMSNAHKTTRVYAVDIDEIKAKRKKFDENKEELKWQKD